MNRREIAEIVASGLNRHERQLNRRLLDALLTELLQRLGSLAIDWRSEGGFSIRRQLLAFLKYRVAAHLGEVFELRRRYAEYTKLYSRAGTLEDKERHVLDFARDLGATRRQLRGDRKAFSRWFGHDAITERYVRKHNGLEREMSLVLERIGAISESLLAAMDPAGGDPAAAWLSLDLGKTLKPFFAYDGDSRVSTAAFRCLSRALRALPAEIQERSVDEGTLQFIYRCAMHTRLDVWLQCEALSLLESLSPTSLEKVLKRRLENPAPNDDLFVRRRAVELLGRNFERLPRLAPLFSVVAKDPSPFVRQGFAEILWWLPAELASAWLLCLALEDEVPQVRASALLAGLGLLARFELREAVLLVLQKSFSVEKDPFVLRVGVHVAAEGARSLVEAPGESQGPFATRWLSEVVPSLERLHLEAQSIPVRRWAALARERIWCGSNAEARELRSALEELSRAVSPGQRRRLPRSIPLPWDDVAGRVLSVLSQDDWTHELDDGWAGPRLTRGNVFVFKPWRLLHELRNPSPDKRQAFPHTIGRRFRAGLRAPSAILAELAETRVPGEPLFIAEEGGWRPYLPLLDEVIAALGRDPEAGPVKIYTSEGVTELSPPRTLLGRLSALWKITARFPQIAKLRNWRSQLQESPAAYARALEEMGFSIRLRAHAGEDGAPATAIDPAARRFFPAGLPLIPAELWSRLQEYFVSVYDNSLFELAIFITAASALFAGRHLYATATARKWRSRMPLVVGGWGTRGKSGTERLKAALFNALGYGVVSKTTGCEAMFLCAHPFGKTREMFLFRSYDKATIWEQRNVLRLSHRLGAEVFLWECMALTPSYVEVLQQHWVRDDISTITNTYPDHEDLQGPAGIDIPEVIGVFIPTRSRAITTEEVMLPILKEIARKKGTALRPVSWVEQGLIAPDVLKRFPYEEHPSNVALVLALADELGIRRDFALKEMADRVVPDLGVLKTSPVARVRTRRLQFSNGCSANERHGTISNWVRCGFDVQDPVKEPGVWITTVVNNRADRVPRSRVFARILVEDIYADRHFLIGGNLAGLVGYIRQSWDAYAPTVSLWPKDAPEDPAAVLREMARRFRVPFEAAHVAARLRAMAGAQDAAVDLGSSTDGLWSNLAALREKLTAAGLGRTADAILRHHGENLEVYLACESFRSRVRSAPRAERAELDAAFRELLWKWFEKKLVVVEDYYISGDQLIHLIAEETPPGYMNRVMGIQNIKGTGLDFVYRWQAWDACWRACEQLRQRDAPTAERGLRALSSFREYGILCEEHVREALAAVKHSPAAQSEAFQSELALVSANFEQAMAELGEKLRAVRRKTGRFERLVGAVESFVDAGDAVKRRKTANRIYRDLVDQRISYERAALELQNLNKRQKGGWLLEKIAAARGALARRVSTVVARAVK